MSLPEVGPGKGSSAVGCEALGRHIHKVADPCAEGIGAPSEHFMRYKGTRNIDTTLYITCLHFDH